MCSIFYKFRDIDLILRQTHQFLTNLVYNVRIVHPPSMVLKCLSDIDARFILVEWKMKVASVSAHRLGCWGRAVPPVRIVDFLIDEYGKSFRIL